MVTTAPARPASEPRARRLLPPEWRRLLLVLVALVGLGWLAGNVVTHFARGFVLDHVDGPPERYFARHHRHGLHRALWALTHLGSVVVVSATALALGAGWRLARRSWALLEVLAVGVAGGVVLTGAVKLLVRRVRPPALGAPAAREYSFPSGHTVQSTVLYGLVAVLVVLALEPRVLRWAVAAAGAAVVGLVGFSRVYLSAHWTTDVIAGLLLAGTWVGVVAATLGPGWWERRSPLVRELVARSRGPGAR